MVGQRLLEDGLVHLGYFIPGGLLDSKLGALELGSVWGGLSSEW